ncbi:hypothetical protein L7F22_005426 [Adiantum nelumboides]|nr:hypothetical protein [Adiantum nelumboides]
MARRARSVTKGTFLLQTPPSQMSPRMLSILLQPNLMPLLRILHRLPALTLNPKRAFVDANATTTLAAASFSSAARAVSNPAAIETATIGINAAITDTAVNSDVAANVAILYDGDVDMVSLTARCSAGPNAGNLSDEKGIKLVTEWRKKKDGALVKVIKSTVRVKLQLKKLSPAVAARRSLKEFGDAVGQNASDNLTVGSIEEVFLERARIGTTAASSKQDGASPASGDLASLGNASLIVCRICNEDRG